MRRSFPLALVMAFGLAVCTGLAPRAWAQTGSDAELEREAGLVYVTGTSVAEMAGFIVGVLQESATVPDWLQAKTTEGQVQRLSAADGFVALARTMRQWDVDGALPESVPVAAGAVSAPVLSVGDLPEQIDGDAEPRIVPTDLFVAQSAEVVRRIGQFRMVPAAVYVGRERISAQDYMAGMAIAIDYAYRNNKVETDISLVRFNPPPAWIAHTELFAEYVEEEVAEGDTGNRGGPPAAERNPAPSQAAAPSVPPKLALLPASGATVSGVVDLVISYAGPRAKFVTVLVDRQLKSVANTAPYGYRWDTSRLPPGTHWVKVRVLGDGDAEIISTEATYTVAAPKATTAGNRE